MTCRKISESVLFTELKCECLIRKFPGGKQGVYKTLLLLSVQSISLNPTAAVAAAA